MVPNRVGLVVSEAEAVLADGSRLEIVALLAALVSLCVLATERVEALKAEPVLPKPEMLTCREVASELRLNEETVRILCRQRKIACIRVGRCMRVPRAELDRFKRDHVTS